MTRKLLGFDRFIVLVVGVGLVLLGLLAVDWKNHYVLNSYSDTLRTSATGDVLTSSWWPWVFAIAGVILGVLALWWLLAHLRREGPSRLRTNVSDETGRVEVDIRSVATAAAAYLATVAPVVNPRGTTRTYGGTTLVLLRGRVDPAADVESLTQAATTCTNHITAAFPNDKVECRVVLDSPQRKNPGRSNRVRVR